jgi:hypothetical protein
MAAKDNRITMKELRRISMAGGKRVKKAVRMSTKKTRGIKIRMSSGGGGNRMMGGNKPKPTHMYQLPKIDTKKDIKKENKREMKRGKVIKKGQIKLPESSSGYKKFDYGKSLKSARRKAKATDNRLRKLQGTPMKIFNKKQTAKLTSDIGKTTGYNKVKGRIGPDGQLRDKKGTKAAMAPSFDKFKKERDQIKSPYAQKFMKLGKKLGVKYGEEARTKRTRMRVAGLTRRLGSDKVFGGKNKSGYGDAGSDALRKFTETKIPKTEAPKTEAPKTKAKGPVSGKKDKYGNPKGNYDPKKWEKK